MKTTLKILVLALCLAFAATPVCAAAREKETNYLGKVKITPNELAQRGDSLYVDMYISLDGASVESRKALDIIPVLTDGTQSKDLPKVSLKGRRKYGEYLRQQTLMSKKQKAAQALTAPYAVEKGYNNSRIVNYKYAIPYEKWMADAHLDAKSDLCGCGDGARQVAMQRLVDNVATERLITPYIVRQRLAFVNPEVEEVKHRALSGESFLDFKVAKTVIEPEFGNNPTELKRIREMIESVRDDKGVTIRGLDITGYASPEGSLALNQRLSEGRAKALQNYLQTRYTAIPKSQYAIHFGGEDWEGLIKAVKSSGMEGKQDVLDIIESTGIEDGREKQLMALDGGKTYNYMLKDLFPSLRRVIVKVDYQVKNFSVTEAAEVMKTRPQNLSLNEMYIVANTYEKGSQEFNDVFETAARLFPDDETANLNAACAALERGDTVLGERYLGRVKSKVRIPEYDNAKGVLYLLKGDYDKAEQSLKAAADAGLTEAQSNLEELAKKRENSAQIAKQHR